MKQPRPTRTYLVSFTHKATGETFRARVTADAEFDQGLFALDVFIECSVEGGYFSGGFIAPDDRTDAPELMLRVKDVEDMARNWRMGLVARATDKPGSSSARLGRFSGMGC